MTSSKEFWPDHAYVPGQTARHPEGAFDAIRDTARGGMPAEDLIGSEAFRTGIRFLDNGFFWEAHEVLEPVWMALPDTCGERRAVQALIQVANGWLKLRMRRPKAARRLVHIAEDLAQGASGVDGAGVSLGERIAALCDAAEHALRDGGGLAP